MSKCHNGSGSSNHRIEETIANAVKERKPPTKLPPELDAEIVQVRASKSEVCVFHIHKQVSV